MKGILIKPDNEIIALLTNTDLSHSNINSRQPPAIPRRSPLRCHARRCRWAAAAVDGDTWRVAAGSGECLPSARPLPPWPTQKSG